MKVRTERGFTLIELLVVIAIIGILASIILASLSTARSKGNDAKVEEQMKNVQTAAAEYYATNGNYGTSAACATMLADTASGMATLMTASNWPSGSVPTCQGTGNPSTAYLMYEALSTSGNSWCVDSNGSSKLETSAISGTATACP